MAKGIKWQEKKWKR